MGINVVHFLEDLPSSFANTAVAIGVFDGVHRGHQEILHQTAREGRSQGLTPLALTFDIHPTELFRPESAPAYIASLPQRAELIRAYGGVNAVVVARFDRAFASLTPDDFVANILESQLGARHVLVGADFCYGKGRAGTVTTLAEAGARNGFAVTIVPPIMLEGERISSTNIRRMIADGDIPGAVRLLGHPFIIQGHVTSGKKLGRTLGFPTANLTPDHPRQLLPANGVYAAYAQLDSGAVFRAAVSVGINPTTDQDGLHKIEAFLMDGFDSDIYGQNLSLDFHKQMRGEAKFDSLSSLVAHIERDVAEIAALLPSKL